MVVKLLSIKSRPELSYNSTLVPMNSNQFRALSLFWCWTPGMFIASLLGRTSRALTNVIHLLAVTAPENDCPFPVPCVTAFPSGPWLRYFSLRLYSSCDGALIPSAYVKRNPSFSAFAGVIPATGWRWIWMSHLYGTNIYKNNNSKGLQQAAPNLGAKSPGSSAWSEKRSSDLEIIVHSSHRKG